METSPRSAVGFAMDYTQWTQMMVMQCAHINGQILLIDPFPFFKLHLLAHYTKRQDDIGPIHSSNSLMPFN